MRESDRLALLYELNNRLVQFREIAPLVRFATQRVQELFEATGCALLLLDASGEHLEFTIASQAASAPSEQQLRALRFPSSRGVAGRVLATGQAAMLTDAQSDPDLFRRIDEATNQRTQTLMCVPVATPRRSIGVLEVVNARPEGITEDNLQFLAAIGRDIGIAYEVANWMEDLQREADASRRTRRCLAWGGVLGGFLWCVLLVVVGSVWSGRWADALRRPDFWLGVAAVAAGAYALSRVPEPRRSA